MTRRRALAVGVALVAVLALVAFCTRRDRPSGPPVGLASGERDARAPSGARVQVEVLNATPVRGLARRATWHLRERGFDVVATGNAGEERDSSLVLDRSGRVEWARLVAQAMGGARVESRPDTSRYLDVTVLVGRDWQPPAEPFRP